MKRVSIQALFICLLAVFCASMSHAQEEDSTAEGEPGMAHAFGNGNGVRGTVTAATSKSFTIHTEEGETYQVLFSPNTRLMKDRQPVAAADVHVGDMLMAGGLVDAKAKTVGAVFIFDIDANDVKTARAGFGKTWVAGKVTAIHELKLTIERAGDKQSQIVAVDENTSFRKHREDVTLADIKVGDFITAQGALHADIFTAAALRIMTGPPGGRSHGFADGPASPAPAQ